MLPQFARTLQVQELLPVSSLLGTLQEQSPPTLTLATPAHPTVSTAVKPVEQLHLHHQLSPAVYSVPMDTTFPATTLLTVQLVWYLVLAPHALLSALVLESAAQSAPAAPVPQLSLLLATSASPAASVSTLPALKSAQAPAELLPPILPHTLGMLSTKSASQNHLPLS